MNVGPTVHIHTILIFMYHKKAIFTGQLHRYVDTRNLEWKILKWAKKYVNVCIYKRTTGRISIF